MHPKRLVNLTSCVITLSLITALGCGPGVDDVDRPATLSGKLTEIRFDHSSSALAFMVINSVAYLNQVTHTLFNLGEDLLTCQTIRSSGQSNFEVVSDCAPPTTRFRGFSGTEAFEFISPSRESLNLDKVYLSFLSGKMSTRAPLNIHVVSENALTVTHALTLTRSGSNYQFELRSIWKTRNTDPKNGLAAEWDTLIKGRLIPEGRYDFGARVSDLTGSVDAKLSYMKVAEGLINETSHIDLTLTLPPDIGPLRDGRLSKEGYPTGTLRGKYTTSLFPTAELPVTLYVNPALINNPDLNSQLLLAPSSANSFPWTDNSERAVNYQRRARGL